MENFDHGSLKIVVNTRGKYVTMSWIGQSDAKNPQELLTPYLTGLIEDLEKKNLTIEFNRLEYMNSSTVPPIVQFLKKLDTNGIKTVVKYDMQSSWQRASFRGLEAMAMMLENVGVEGV